MYLEHFHQSEQRKWLFGGSINSILFPLSTHLFSSVPDVFVDLKFYSSKILDNSHLVCFFFFLINTLWRLNPGFYIYALSLSHLTGPHLDVIFLFACLSCSFFSNRKLYMLAKQIDARETHYNKYFDEL